MNSLQEKKSGTNFVYEATWKNAKTFTAGNACLKTSIFSQTDSIDEKKLINSNFKAQIAGLKNSIVSQTDPGYEMNWFT